MLNQKKKCGNIYTHMYVNDVRCSSYMYLLVCLLPMESLIMFIYAIGRPIGHHILCNQVLLLTFLLG